eukprot:TRINITY_DN11184_c0_g1_i1.p1 TRINITY_DN11184_c0_g1~~TRINITY_DN11184_c0_g1_i1.p1  ORF type:complete len:108 (-),score=5.67 TRINITY_DN11184_c0_g1_i1:19-342(-)
MKLTKAHLGHSQSPGLVAEGRRWWGAPITCLLRYARSPESDDAERPRYLLPAAAPASAAAPPVVAVAAPPPRATVVAVAGAVGVANGATRPGAARSGPLHRRSPQTQ